MSMPAPAFIKQDPAGLHYAVRIFVGSTAIWLVAEQVGHADTLWAIISLIVVTEPLMQTAWQAFRSRAINTAVGCVTGLSFLFFVGPRSWSLPLALFASVLICTYVVRPPLSWRIGPITAAMIVMAGLEGHSRSSGLEVSVRRAVAVVLGCATALLVTAAMGYIWPLASLQPIAKADGPAAENASNKERLP